MSAAERFTLPSQPALNSNFAPLSRLSGEIIVVDNYGAYNQFTEIVIGAVNVGTVLTFAQKITDYLYVDVTFFGNAAAFIVYGPERVIQISHGASGVICGLYTRRIPYCGDIESITFLQTGYTVKSIDVVSQLQPYSIEETDLTQFTLTSTAGWTYDSGSFFKTMTTLTGLTVGFGGGVIQPGYTPRLGAQINLITNPNVAVSDTLYSDGVRATSIAALNPVELWLPTDGLNAPQGSIVFTNNTNASFTVQLTPKVMSFLPLSSAFGATPT